MRNPVLYFFILVLKVPLNLIPNIIYKCGRFSKTFSKKNFKFIPYRKISHVTFKLGLILFQVKADFFLKDQKCKTKPFMALALSILK